MDAPYTSAKLPKRTNGATDGFLLSVKVIRIPDSLLRPVVSDSAKFFARADRTGKIALTAGMKTPKKSAYKAARLPGM